MNIYLGRNNSKYRFWFIYDFFWPPKEAVVLDYSPVLPDLHFILYCILYASGLFILILSFINIKCFFCLFVRWSHKETEQLMRRSLRNRQLSVVFFFPFFFWLGCTCENLLYKVISRYILLLTLSNCTKKSVILTRGGECDVSSIVGFLQFELGTRWSGN